jgi:uncharacterized protein (TIGR02466 family)
MIKDIFPVQLYEKKLDNLLPLANKMFEVADFSGGYTTWFSKERCPDTREAYTFKQEILKHTTDFAIMQGLDMNNFKAQMTSFGLWLNKMPNGQSHESHIHGGSQYSGTFYVNAPEGSSNIRYHNPNRLLWKYNTYPIIRYNNTASCDSIDETPEAGKLLLWNSWLEHEVLVNESTTPRLSISFNIEIVEK